MFECRNIYSRKAPMKMGQDHRHKAIQTMETWKHAIHAIEAGPCGTLVAPCLVKHLDPVSWGNCNLWEIVREAVEDG